MTPVRDTLKDHLVSGVMWALAISWLVPNMSLLMALQTIIPSHRLSRLTRLYIWGQLALTGARWRAVVHPEVQPDRQYMFCQNHINHFDHVTMYRATPHFKQGLELESHFKVPVYGWFMRQRGTIPVPLKREGRYESIRARMQRELARDRSLLVFPEGTRTRTGRVGEFKSGVFFMARDLGVPVVPVAVTGMQEIMRANSWVIRPGREVTVYCERPVEMQGCSDQEVVRRAREVRQTVSRRVDEYLERGAR